MVKQIGPFNLLCYFETNKQADKFVDSSRNQFEPLKDDNFSSVLNKEARQNVKDFLITPDQIEDIIPSPLSLTMLDSSRAFKRQSQSFGCKPFIEKKLGPPWYPFWWICPKAKLKGTHLIGHTKCKIWATIGKPTGFLMSLSHAEAIVSL